MGSASLVDATIREMMQRSPDELRRLLWSDKWLKLGLRAFEKRLRNATRDGVRNYFEAIEVLSGKQDKALLLLLSSLGVQQPEELRPLVEMARRAQGTDVAEAKRQVALVARALIASDPAQRDWFRREVLGERELDLSPATDTAARQIGDAILPPHGNGTNGHGGRA